MKCCTEKDKKDSPVPRRWFGERIRIWAPLSNSEGRKASFTKVNCVLFTFKVDVFFSLDRFKVESRCTSEIIYKLSNYFLKSLDGKKIQNLLLILFTMNKEFGTQKHDWNQRKKVTIVQSLTICNFFYFFFDTSNMMIVEVKIISGWATKDFNKWRGC